MSRINFISKKKFNFRLPSKFFFENEKKLKYKLFENVKLNDLFWKNYLQKKEKRKKLLLISGLSRSGNHLLLSILDQHSQISLCGGEDGMLRNLLSMIKKFGEEKIIYKIKNSDYRFFSKLSGSRIKKNKIFLFDKWKKVAYLKNITKLRHSGTQGLNFTTILDFKNIKIKVFYKKYINYLKKKKKFNNFFDFFYHYLDAQRVLFGEKNKNQKYHYTYFHSGLRREINFLLERKIDAKIIVPVRDFKTFYFSYLKGIYRTEKVTSKTLNDIWENWFHKVVDFLKLKKKFPKNVIIVFYEDIVDRPKVITNRILKKLGLKKMIKIKTSILGKPSLGNSSFSIKNLKPGQIYKNQNKMILKNRDLPREYRYVMKKLIKEKI